MRSKQLALDKYNTDKIKNHYLEYYDLLMEPWVDKKLNLLEIGVYGGDSLRLWRDYFPKGEVVGVDIKTPENGEFGDRIHFFRGSQTDTKFLTDMCRKVAPEGFDIIIDDASHIGDITKITFWHMFDNHLKSGGLYVIEDWGTGYWEDFPDGKKHKIKQSVLSSIWRKILQLNLPRRLILKMPLKIPIRSHNYGMVGFIKELIDEQGAADSSRSYSIAKPARQSKFENILIARGLCFVKKN